MSMLRIFLFALLIGLILLIGSPAPMAAQDEPTPAPVPPQRCEVFIRQTAEQLAQETLRLYGIEPGSIKTWEDLVNASQKLRDAGFITLDTGELVAPRI